MCCDKMKKREEEEVRVTRQLICNEDEIFRFSNVKYCGTVMHSHHYHNLYEIYYLISGKCNFFVDDKTYEVVEGDLILIPAGVIHKTNYSREEHARIVIECSPKFIPESVKSSMKNMVHLYRNESASKDIYGILKKIEDEHHINDEYTPESLHALMELLFFCIMRNQNNVGITESKNRMVESVASYIKDNYNTDISLSAMAHEHFVSPEHLSRTFKRETGFGFNEFITLVRLQHAESMLKDRGNKSISEIAYCCGFNDSNYFSNKFKKMYGVSPLAFSKSCK